MRTSKIKPIDASFTWNYAEVNASNDAADEIIRSPDLHLLNKNELFAAEGGWNTFAFTAGLSGVAVLGLFASNGRLFSHFKHGQLRF